MIIYTKAQLMELFVFILEAEIYGKLFLKTMIISTRRYKEIMEKKAKNVDIRVELTENDILNQKTILHRMSLFSHIKIGSNYPNRTIRKTVREIRNLIFHTDKENLPLYINETNPWLKMIAVWRLKNNI